MRGLFDKIALVFGWMDAAEFAIPAILAALLLVIGPLLASFYFLRGAALYRCICERWPLDSGGYQWHP